MTKNIVQKQQSISLEIGKDLPIEIFGGMKKEVDDEIIRPEILKGFHFTNDIQLFSNEIRYFKRNNLVWFMFQELGHYTCHYLKAIHMKRLMRVIKRHHSFAYEIPKSRQSFDLRMRRLRRLGFINKLTNNMYNEKFYYLSDKGIILYLLLFKFHDGSDIMFRYGSILNQANLQCEFLNDYKSISDVNIKIHERMLEAKNRIDIFEAFEILEKEGKATKQEIEHWIQKNISQFSEFDEIMVYDDLIDDIDNSKEIDEYNDDVDNDNNL